MPRFIWFDPQPAGSSQTVTVDYIASYVSTTSGATHTFTSSSIGTAVAGRVVAVCVNADDAGGAVRLSSGTIAASAATVNATSETKPGAAAVMSLAVASGTTATIAVTLSKSAPACAIHVFAIYGASSATPTDTLSKENSTSGTITIPAGGVCVGVANAAAQGRTWTVTGITKDADADYGSSHAYCVGSVESLLGGTATVQSLPSGSPSTHQAYAAWG